MASLMLAVDKPEVLEAVIAELYDEIAALRLRAEAAEEEACLLKVRISHLEATGYPATAAEKELLCETVESLTRRLVRSENRLACAVARLRRLGAYDPPPWDFQAANCADDEPNDELNEGD